MELKAIWKLLSSIAYSKATDDLRFVLAEREAGFALVLFGFLVGLPAPPAGITLRLLPFMENDVKRLKIRDASMDDIFGDLAGMLMG